MNRRAWLWIVLLSGPLLVWSRLRAAQEASDSEQAPAMTPENLQSSKAELERAREEYKQEVEQFGPQSPQAEQAREHLRLERHAFHTQRRSVRPEKPRDEQ